MAKGRGKTGSAIPKDETKSARFKRVVSPRVTKALKAIRVIGYCSGVAYEYEPEQVEQILLTLNTTVEELGLQFSKKTKGDTGFEFS